MPTTSYYRFDSIETKLADAATGRHSLFSNEEFAAELSERLDELLAGRTVLSLDVFDTFVLRDNSSEMSRFFEVGERMAAIVESEIGAPVSKVDAFVARHLGTKATYRTSRRRKGCREGSLTELHRTASRLLVGDARLTEKFVTAEIENEATRIVPNPFLVAYAKRHRERGGKLALVTDMYMHADQVGLLLQMLGIESGDYDLLISSADTKVSKASVGIFELFEEELDAKSDQFVHVGDSFRGDVAQPINRGWRALHLPISEFDLIERRRDHLKTGKVLADEHKLSVSIAMPR